MTTEALQQEDQLDNSIQRQQTLKRIIRDSCADVEPYLELAQIYRSLDKPFEAQQVLEQAAKVASDNEQVLWELEEATLARSLQRLLEVKDLHSRHPTPLETANLENAQIEWANRRKDVCRKRLSRDPSQTGLRIVLAEALFELNQYDDAIEALVPALDDPQHSPKAYLMQGLCQQATGKELEALASLRAAALRRSVQPPAGIKLAALRHAADLSMRLGLTATCRRYLRGIVQLCPDDASAKRLLARIESKDTSEFHDQETLNNVASNR